MGREEYSIRVTCDECGEPLGFLKTGTYFTQTILLYYNRIIQVDSKSNPYLKNICCDRCRWAK